MHTFHKLNVVQHSRFLLGANILPQTCHAVLTLQGIQQGQATEYVADNPLLVMIERSPVVQVVGQRNPGV